MGETRNKAKGGPEAVFGPERQTLFLESVRETCHFGRSVAAAGVSNVTVYNYRNRDPQFERAYVEALADGVRRTYQRLVDEGIDRAGYEKSCTEIARHNTWLARRLRALDMEMRGGAASAGGVPGRGQARGRGRAFGRTRADVERSLLGKLSLLNKRMGGKG